MNLEIEIASDELTCGRCGTKGNWIVETKTGELFCDKCKRKEHVFYLDKRQCKEVEKEQDNPLKEGE